MPNEQVRRPAAKLGLRPRKRGRANGHAAVELATRSTIDTSVADTPALITPITAELDVMLASQEGAAALDFLASRVNGVEGVLASGLGELRMARRVSDVCKSFIRDRIDGRTLLTLRAAMEAPLADREARAITKNLQKRGIPAAQQAAILGALSKIEVPEYRKRLREIEEITDDIDATRTLLRLAHLRFSHELNDNYDKFAEELEQTFVASNEKLLKQLDVLLIEFGQRLVESRVTSLAQFATVAVGYLKDVLSRGDQKDAFLKTVRSSIQHQLQPANLKRAGLTHEFIGSEYARFAMPAKINEDQRRAIFLLVKTMLLTRYDNSEFVAMLNKHDLRGYAELHGRLMDHQIRLMAASQP
jgi:hypothetical protein